MIPADLFTDFIQSVKALTESRNLTIRTKLSDIVREAQKHNTSVDDVAREFLDVATIEALRRAELIAREMVEGIDGHQAALAENEVLQAKQLTESWLSISLDQLRNELFGHSAFASFPHGITDQRVSDFFGNGLSSARGTALGNATEILKKNIKAAKIVPVATAAPLPKKQHTVTPCPSCAKSQPCTVHCAHSTGVRGDDDFMWVVKFSILECEVCATCFAQRVSSNSEDRFTACDQEGNEEEIEIEQFTYLPSLKLRVRPAWLTSFADYLNRRALLSALEEMYSAIDNKLLMLAGIGARTCFDMSSEILGVDPNLSFNKKLEELYAKRKIAEGTKDHLSVLVEFGNATAHRGWLPTSSQIQTMADVLEAFLVEVFVREDERKVREIDVARVKSSVPPRPAPTKTA